MYSVCPTNEEGDRTGPGTADILEKHPATGIGRRAGTGGVKASAGTCPAQRKQSKI